MTQPKRRAKAPAQSPPEQPRPAFVPRTPAERFGARMYDLADIMLPATEATLPDKHQFARLMVRIAEQFAELAEPDYYDRVREATDLLPMTRATANQFAVKIRAEIARLQGETDG